MRRKWQALEREKERLFLKLKRLPTRDEMAASMEMTMEDYDAFCEDARIFGLISGDQFLDDDSSETIMSTVASPGILADEEMIGEETWGEIEEFVDRLSDKERTVVQLYYLADMNLKQIGERLKVTESRVCQLRGQAIKRLQLWIREKEQAEATTLEELRIQNSQDTESWFQAIL